MMEHSGTRPRRVRNISQERGNEGYSYDFANGKAYGVEQTHEFIRGWLTSLTFNLT